MKSLLEGTNINMLPQDCVSTILCLTSPPDACRSSLVTSSFGFAAESDIVWERFLPVDYPDIISRSASNLKYNSKKELFQLLCHPILIDDGNKSFKLKKCSGKKSYILSARELSITWSNEPMYWTWKSLPESRFAEVAELRTTSWLEIQGKFRTGMLSSNTKYGAYLIIKITDRAYGLDLIPSEISVEVGNQVTTNMAHLRRQDSNKQKMESLFYMNRMQMLNPRVIGGDGRVPIERADGWLEIELGEFFTGTNDEEVKMHLMEVKGYQLKGGLIVEGIELRPKS